MYIPDRLAASPEKDALLLGVADGSRGMADWCNAFDDNEDALRYYAMHVQRVAVPGTRFCAGCGQHAEMRYKTQWKAVVDHHAARNVAMTVVWTLLAMVPFFKWFVSHTDWLQEARELSFACEQPVCVTCADGIGRKALPALVLRAVIWLLKAASVAVLACSVAMVFMLWRSTGMDDKADFKVAVQCLGASAALFAACQLLGPALCARVEFPAFARKIGRRPFVLQSGEAQAAAKLENPSPQGKVFHFDTDPSAEARSSRRTTVVAVVLGIGILAGIVGGGVWMYRKSAASMAAKAQQREDDENAIRRRLRAAHAANEAAAHEAETAPVPK